MNYRWIYKQCTKVNGKEYHFYSVIIKGKYKYSSSKLEHCIDFVFSFLRKNDIDESKVINDKHRVNF